MRTSNGLLKNWDLKMHKTLSRAVIRFRALFPLLKASAISLLFKTYTRPVGVANPKPGRQLHLRLGAEPVFSLPCILLAITLATIWLLSEASQAMPMNIGLTRLRYLELTDDLYQWRLFFTLTIGVLPVHKLRGTSDILSELRTSWQVDTTQSTRYITEKRQLTALYLSQIKEKSLKMIKRTVCSFHRNKREEERWMGLWEVEQRKSRRKNKRKQITIWS